MATKICRTCGIEKDICEFIPKRNHCKVCIKAYNKEYYVANSEKIKAHSKEYCAANSEKIKAYKKEYYVANSEKMKAHRKEYYAANSEKIKAHCKEYYAANSEKMKAHNKEYRVANSEKIKAYEDERSKRKWIKRCMQEHGMTEQEAIIQHEIMQVGRAASGQQTETKNELMTMGIF